MPDEFEITPEDIQSDISAIEQEMEADAASVGEGFTEQTDAPYELNEVMSEIDLTSEQANDVDSIMEAAEDDFAQFEEILPEAKETQELTEIEGWVKDINPNFNPEVFNEYQENCGSCALAVKARLDGDHEMVASADNIGTIEEMNQLTGMEQVSMSPEEIQEHLISMGPGANAIIGIDRADGPGHWFNAYFDGEKVVAVEGQSGEVRGWPPDYGEVTNWDICVKKETD